MRSILTVMISTGLVACGPAQNDPGPGGVTVGEAQALDEAAKMLDERNAPPQMIENAETSPAETE
ncbi:MAG: hypothetical protein AB8B54_11835 [Sphingorhabdus sp.]